MRFLCATIWLLATVGGAFGQAPTVPMGKGVTAPSLLKKVDPQYTEEAKSARLSGRVLLRIVVTEVGTPEEIEVISPLGFGLDEKAVEAVQRWKFKAGMKDGAPVRIRAEVEVNFDAGTFDHKEEDLRTKWNAAITDLAVPDRKGRAIAALQSLASKDYPPALVQTALWMKRGENLPKDEAAALARIQKAASKKYGPGMYELAMAWSRGELAAPTPDRIRKLLDQAAKSGSAPAQAELGNRYQQGNGVDKNLRTSREYFRMCAADGFGACQLHLGAMLLAAGDDTVQGTAWVQLAAESGTAGAASLAEKSASVLTPEQQKQLAALKPRLVHPTR